MALDDKLGKNKSSCPDAISEDSNTPHYAALVVALSEQAGACRVLFSPCWDFERGRGYRWGSGEESLRN